MNLEDFVSKAIKQDSRNVFEPYTGDVSFIPFDLVQFYVEANPIDVEIRTRKFGNMHFYPIGQIKALNEDYSFMPKDSFIFATTNGDPIFIEDGKYYITNESSFSPELLSDNLSEFLDIIRII